MSHVLSFTCLEQQHVELLPARTVLSMFVTHGTDNGSGNGFGPAVLKMLGITTGPGTSGPDGSDGQSQPNS